jgi:hypothetical protein
MLNFKTVSYHNNINNIISMANTQVSLAAALKRREELRDLVERLAALPGVAVRRPLIERIGIADGVEKVVDTVKLSPVENLTREYDWHMEMYIQLDVPIQLKNAEATVEVPDEVMGDYLPLVKDEPRQWGSDRLMTLTAALARRRQLEAKIKALAALKHNAMVRPFVTRVPVNDTTHEVRAVVPTVSAAELSNALTWHSRQVRRIDDIIQDANHSPDNQIAVAAEVFTDYIRDAADEAVTANPGDESLVMGIMGGRRIG